MTTSLHACVFSSFLFDAPPASAIYTLSLHDALPISARRAREAARADHRGVLGPEEDRADREEPRAAPAPRRTPQGPDRKSTRLNSSHLVISYAVFCLKKKNTRQRHNLRRLLTVQ